MPLFLTKPMQNCFLLLVEILPCSCYYDVENNSKGGTYMRKTYIDNIRWMTVVIVVIYHVFYMFNGVVTSGVIGPFTSVQYQDSYLYYKLIPAETQPAPL